MIRLIAVAAFAWAVATSAQAMTLAPLHQPDPVITQARMGCGLGRVRVNGVCVARTNCILWFGGCMCPRWYGGTCGWAKYSWRGYR
jgi:hypothetical protein